MKKRIAILTLLIPFVLIGCSNKNSNENTPIDPTPSEGEPSGGGSEGDPTIDPETPVAVTSVSLSQSTLEIYTDDSPVYLVATVLPENATDKSVTWSSSNTSVATVDNGMITPVSAGSTNITVITVDGNKTAQCTVTVKQASTIPNYVLHGLYYGDSEWTDKPMVANPYSTTEYMLQGVSLHANDVFKVHMYGDTWYGYSAVKNSVKSGLVTAAPTDDNIKVITTGVYDIYCDYNASDNGHIYLDRVDESTPTPSNVSVTGISLSNTGKYLLFRNEFVITATVTPANATNKDVYWSSSDTTIATVTSGGRVVAKEKKGTTTITARTADGNFTATCIVYVNPSQYPDYCLTGTIGGRSYISWNTKYAAIPLSTGKFLIPDVELVAGDEITVTDNSGAKLKDKYNHIYTKTVSKNMSVNVYLNINDTNHDYLSFVAKAES